MGKASILVIDDEPLMRESLRDCLLRRGYQVYVADGAETGWRLFSEESPWIVVTDLRMKGAGGLEVLRKVKEQSRETPVIMMTAFATVENAVSAMKEGAFDYIVKPFRPEEFEVVVSRAVEFRELLCENEQLRSALGQGEPKRWVMGDSPRSREVFTLAQKVAGSDGTVLIEGETGTGKEILAHAIHGMSPRRGRPLLCVNCAALSAGLLESELFGHEKGAFTGADRFRKGRFELAEGGTLLLDEVSEIDPGLQSKLLRVLQEKSFERVGSSISRQADVRVIATTNRHLAQHVKEGNFREDLYYRLHVLPLVLPPLRERVEDLPALVEYFLAKHGRGRMVRLEEGVLEMLRRYPWPGNVRELENVVERALVLEKDEVLSRSWFAASLGGEPVPGAETQVGPGQALSLEAMEKNGIAAALSRCGGHRELAARELGITTKTLRAKIRKFGLES